MNLKKIEVLSASLLIVLFAQIFPYALRHGRILLWILGVGGFLLLAIVIMVARNRERVINEEDTYSDQPEVIDLKGSEEAQIVTDSTVVLIEVQQQMDLEAEVAEDDDSKAELIVEDLADAANYKEFKDSKEPTESIEATEAPELPVEPELIEVIELEQDNEPLEPIDAGFYEEPNGFETVLLSEETESNASSSSLITSFRQTEEFGLEYLIDRGFQAKEQGRFHLAAEWFILALEQKPSYDIAYYLIMEICEHWKNGSSIYDALDKVTPYLNEYIQNAPPEWGIKLVEWLEVENLPVPREILGRND
ncbi:MFS transporter [Desulfitobacterium dichloroeliminans]|uniref:MFS transporter n=1 Tax=Desulfitobacterium dichloroeliminans TaxID=233055 RepID=UPI001FA7212A|nr:MFS transporter [Desulfitobacterium dichloroeliminans]